MEEAHRLERGARCSKLKSNELYHSCMICRSELWTKNDLSVYESDMIHKTKLSSNKEEQHQISDARFCTRTNI